MLERKLSGRRRVDAQREGEKFHFRPGERTSIKGRLGKLSVVSPRCPGAWFVLTRALETTPVLRFPPIVLSLAADFAL